MTAGFADRLIDLPARLPGPALIGYAALVPVISVALSAPSWILGDSPVGSVSIRILTAAVLTAYFLGSIHLLNDIALDALSDFIPAIGEGNDTRRLAVDLTAIPDRSALVAAAIVVVAITPGFFSNAVEVERLASLPASVGALETLAWWMALAALGPLILHTLRQLRMVARLHSEAVSIDLLEPGAIVAFARLTSSTAIVLLVIPVLMASFSAVEGNAASPFVIATYAAMVLLAIATFLVPLLGMHERMAAEKERLSGEVHVRVRAVVGLIHGGVDSADLGAADELNKTLSSLLAERDLVGRLSTWPWSPGVARGLLSAVLLPIVIWALIRVLERLV